jgi:hypothetical protein
VKKLITSVLAACFVFGLVGISGCSKKDDKKPADTKTADKEKDK